MDDYTEDRVRRRRGRPPKARLRYWVRLTLSFEEDDDVIEAVLNTPRGHRSALIREALRVFVRTGKMQEFYRERGLE